MCRILQQDQPEDFVIATGQTPTVRDFCTRAFLRAGIEVDWRGAGFAEKGYEQGSDRILVEIDPRYLRPTEVELLLGDASKARTKLGWTPETSFAKLVELMVHYDLRLAPDKSLLNAP